MSIKVFSPGEKIRAADFNDNFDFLESEVNALSEIIDGAPPVGFIALWADDPFEIPDGWVECDGSNGTPDLRGAFAVGAGESYEPGDTGGVSEVELSIEQLPSHSHSSGNMSSGSAGAHSHSTSRWRDSTSAISGNRLWRDFGSRNTSSSGEHSHPVSGDTSASGDSAAHNNLPPYRALIYIQKVA